MSSGVPLMSASPKSSNPNPSGDWSVVSRRRGRRQWKRVPGLDSTILQSRILSLTLDHPSRWIPLDSDSDPERESRLLKRMLSSIRSLESSRFYHRFLSRLREPQIQDGLARVRSSGSGIQMVVYGIGSIASYESPRLQLALAVLLQRELGLAVGSVEVFDPVLSAVECAVVEALGCSVIRMNERGRREATAPTLFYMPHCEAELYDNLLNANWKSSMLNQMVVLGNSFGEYERYVGEMRSRVGSVALEVAARHVLGVRKYAREVGIEERKAIGASGVVEDDDGSDGFFKAFHAMSWHFFELDDDVDLIF